MNFIQNNSQYTLLAHRKTLDDLVSVPVNVSPEFTMNDHFRFGYNGVTFNERASPYDIFWTDYGTPYRDAASLEDEIKAALFSIYTKNSGVIGIEGVRTRNLSILLKICEQENLPITQHVVCIENVTLPNLNSYGEAVIHQVSFDDWIAFCQEYKTLTGNFNVLSAFRAMHSQMAECPLIYHNPGLLFNNQNYDRNERSSVGPEYWTLQDTEAQTSIYYWLMKKGKTAYPDFLRYSPELMASWLNHPFTKRFFVPKEDSDRENSSQNYIEIYGSFVNQPGVSHDMAYNSEIRNIMAKTLEVIPNDPAGDSVKWPLIRLMKRLNVSYDYKLAGAEVFGKVNGY